MIEINLLCMFVFSPIVRVHVLSVKFGRSTTDPLQMSVSRYPEMKLFQSLVS